jgi:tyrosyl-tRNA synthetase
MTLLEELAGRGLIAQISDEPGLAGHLAEGPRTLYCGFDPTADSLHIGNLVPLLTLRRFQQAGHKPILLLGGATGLIGDPSGRSDERALNDDATVADWVENIHRQVQGLLDFEGNNPALIANNLDWTRDLDVISFLRDVGKHFSVNAMIQRDSVRSRLEQDDEGISFTEFSYMLLQAMDFFELASRQDCTLQIGGSDQWGNIVSGMDLVRRKLSREAFALTVPLITKADGTKFGKTAGGNIWLDKDRTSPYKFYQYWLNASDEDAANYIKIFTLLEKDEIEALEKEHNEAPHARLLQRTLAQDITKRVHSQEDLEMAEKASSILFGKSTKEDLSLLDETTLLAVFEGVPQTTISKSDLDGNVADLLSETSGNIVFSSKGEARRMIKGGGVSINKEKIAESEIPLKIDLLQNKYVLVQKGKKNYYLFIVE